MKFIWVVLLAVCFAVGQGAPEDPGATRTRLIALENAWNQAQLRGDSKALETLVTDTFVYTDYDGTVYNKAKFLEDNRDPAYRMTVVTNDTVAVFLYRGAAVIIGAYHAKGSYKGKPFNHYGKFTDTWVFEKEQWRCAATHTNLISRK
jgi:hypothetical protein